MILHTNIFLSCRELPVIEEADFGYCNKPFVHCDRMADFNVLIYVKRGSMEIIEEGITHTLTSGSLFFLKSGLHHYGEKPFEQGTSWYYVHFRCSEPQNDTSNFISLQKHIKFCADSEMLSIMKRICAFHSSGKNLEAALALWEVFLKCRVNTEEHKINSKAVEIKEYIDKNFCSLYTANDLEKALSLSYKYAGELFKAEYKMTISEYKTNLRLNKGARLLCETDLSVNEIARICGYDDCFYFSRVFSKKKGLSPIKYRREYIPGL